MTPAIRNLALTALGLAMSAGIGLAQAAEPIVIKFAHVVAENTPKGQMANKFKELAEARLPGKVTVEVYPKPLALRLMQKGSRRCCSATCRSRRPACRSSAGTPAAQQHLDLPFLFDDMAAVDRFQQGPDEQRILVEKEGPGDPCLATAQRHGKMSADKLWRTPGRDLKGLKNGADRGLRTRCGWPRTRRWARSRSRSPRSSPSCRDEGHRRTRTPGRTPTPSCSTRGSWTSPRTDHGVLATWW